MMRGHETVIPDESELRFKEWSSLFSARLFVMLQVYADESGTDDITGKKNGSSTPTLCGFIETPEYWAGFRRRWQSVLDDYRAPFFHFREFADKEDKWKIKGNPYLLWSEEKRDRFLYDLAFLASEFAVPVGGIYNAKRHHKLGWKGNPFENTIRQFFNDLNVVLNTHWPAFDGKVLFVFDRGASEKWLLPLHNQYSHFSSIDQRLGGMTFEDDKDKMHISLQAADLYAYATRQYAERQMAKPDTIEPMRVLDFILNKNLYVSRRLGITSFVWRLTVDEVRKDQKRQKAIWKKQGMPKKQYYPEENFPFEKYGITRKNRNSI